MQGKEFNKPLLAKELCLIFMPFGTVTNGMKISDKVP